MFKRINSVLSFLLSSLVLVLFIVLIAIPHSFHRPFGSYSLSQTQLPDVNRKLLLLASDGREFATRGGCVEAPVTLDEIPQHLINALLAIEDRRFFSHFGIDPVGILRAASKNHEAGRVVQGGSTITQQLAKISYLSSEKSLERKFEEALLSIWLEFRLSKSQILERYLSSAYFGAGCYGLRAAARGYFEKAVNELNIPESVYLVSLLKSPTMLRSNSGKLHQREKLVLRSMVDEGYLTEAELTEFVSAVPRTVNRKGPGANFADWIESKFQGEKGNPGSPLAIRTTLDLNLQNAAKGAVNSILDKYGTQHKATEAALVAMRTDGRIISMVGGRDYDQSQFNRATQALRQPGSAFKLFVYLTALKAGAELDMKIPDKPMTINDWSPENYNKKYRGFVSLQRAFSSSINTVSVHLSEAVGRDEVISTARDLGITSDLKSVPSIALGTSEVTLLELTAAYAAIAADAYPIKTWGMLNTESNFRVGTSIPKRSGEWQLEVGEPMKKLLQATVKRGTGRAARLSIPSFGKTGTSQEYRDAWFVGFAGNLVVGVWVGNDDYTPMRRVTGGGLPARIWRQFMKKARKIDPEFKLKPDYVAEFERKIKPVLMAQSRDGIFDDLLKKPTFIPKVSFTSRYSSGWGKNGKAPWDEMIVTD